MELFGITLPSLAPPSLTNERTFPARDWLIIVLLWLVLCGALIVWSTTFFLAVRTGEVASDTSVPTPGTTLNRGNLRSVYEGYDAKAHAFESGTVPALLSDPSR